MKPWSHIKSNCSKVLWFNHFALQGGIIFSYYSFLYSKREKNWLMTRKTSVTSYKKMFHFISKERFFVF